MTAAAVRVAGRRLIVARPCSAAQFVSIQQRCIASSTSAMLDKQTIKVPSMGDSITEGTVVEWTAQVGQAVKVDDVVAMVETDKVTVEIKAEAEGVVTQQFCEIDASVEVGAPLYEIDSDAEATVEASSEPAAPSNNVEEEAAPVAVAAKPAKSTSSHKRVPLIKFLGKEGWAQRLMGIPEPEPIYVPPNYGRPSFSEEEMEALILGGASLAPEVVDYSYGAKFQ